MKEETVEESMRFISVIDADGKEIDLDLIKPRKKRLRANVFCPTGKGGGVDPTCKLGGSAKGVSSKPQSKTVKPKPQSKQSPHCPTQSR